MAIEMGEDFPGFAPSAIAAIEAHDWPGNVRELRNFAQRLAHRSMLMHPGEPVVFDPSAMDPFESPWRPSGSRKPTSQSRDAAPQSPVLAQPVLPVGHDFNAQVAALEMRLLDEALAASQGHQGRAAEALGLTYHQLRGLLKKHEYGRKPGKPKEEAGTPLTGPPRPAM